MPNVENYLELLPLFLLSEKLCFANPLTPLFLCIYLVISFITSAFLISLASRKYFLNIVGVITRNMTNLKKNLKVKYLFKSAVEKRTSLIHCDRKYCRNALPKWLLVGPVYLRTNKTRKRLKNTSLDINTPANICKHTQLHKVITHTNTIIKIASPLLISCSATAPSPACSSHRACAHGLRAEPRLARAQPGKAM